MITELTINFLKWWQDVLDRTQHMRLSKEEVTE